MTTLPPDFGVSITDEEFEARFLALHKQLFASTEFGFDVVTTHVYKPPAGMYQVDHSFFHDGEQWHLFYCTGDMTKSDIYTAAMAAGDWERAAANTVEPGIGHAIGPSLRELRYQHLIEPPSLGDFDAITRSNGWAFRYNGRYGMVYGVRGQGGFVGFSLMWSDDLMTWQAGSGNPIFGRPDWAPPGATCKDIHITEHAGTFLLYYVTSDEQGYCCIALISTTDWESFTDHGCVFQAAPMMRGTLGVESMSVVHRNGMWHLFFTYGLGLWHAVSPSPQRFVRARERSYNVGSGYYLMGPFHATEVICDPSGAWWLTTDRKEETRRLNREAGRLCYRGSYEDEKTLEEGLYLSHIRWEGDQPILEKPGNSLGRSVGGRMATDVNPRTTADRST